MPRSCRLFKFEKVEISGTKPSGLPDFQVRSPGERLVTEWVFEFARRLKGKECHMKRSDSPANERKVISTTGLPSLLSWKFMPQINVSLREKLNRHGRKEKSEEARNT